MNAQFTPTLPGSNNAHSSGRRVDTYDRGYKRGSGCNEGTDYEALRLARQGQLDQHGYHNDGFVVSDSHSELDEDSSSDYTLEEVATWLRSQGKDAEDSSSDYHPTDEDSEEEAEEDDAVDSDYVPSDEEQDENAEEDDAADSDYVPSDEEQDDDEDDDSSSDYHE